VLETFDDLTGDFGEVLDRLKLLFGYACPAFVHTDESAAQVFAGLDDYGRRKHGEVPEDSIARPSEERRARTAAVRAAMDDATCIRLRARADALYDRLVTARTA
jgi:hypothetical protein